MKILPLQDRYVIWLQPCSAVVVSIWPLFSWDCFYWDDPPQSQEKSATIYHGYQSTVREKQKHWNERNCLFVFFLQVTNPFLLWPIGPRRGLDTPCSSSGVSSYRSRIASSKHLTVCHPRPCLFTHLPVAYRRVASPSLTPQVLTSLP